MSHPIDVERLRGLALPLAARIEYHDSIDSTNKRAVALSREGAPEGCVVLADEQTAGRGRGDNDWQSTAGLGVYLSVLLRPPTELLETPIFGVLGGLAAVEAFRELTDLAFQVKWPNDVVIDGRKIGGVLAEAVSEPALGVVIGIGLNVHHAPTDLPTDTPVPPTSLAIETAPGTDIDRTAVAAGVLRHLDAAYAAVRTHGVDWLGERVTRVWNERGHWVGFEGGAAPSTEGRATSLDLARGVIHLEDEAGGSTEVPLAAFVRLRRTEGPA